MIEGYPGQRQRLDLKNDCHIAGCKGVSLA